VRLRLALVCAALALASVPAAAGAPGLLVGVVDNSVMWTHQPGPIVGAQRDLGLKAIRLSVDWDGSQWSPTRTQLTELGRGVAASRGLRVVLSVSGFAKDAPHDRFAQDRFCGFVFNLLARYPSVNDVKIWNEPNTGMYWRPQFAEDGTSSAPEEYAQLLARCYDQLHTLRRGINVISGSTSPRGNDNPAAESPSHSPGTFIRELGRAYRELGRQRPIFDTYGHHPYPDSSVEAPTARHPASRSIGQGDLDKLLAALGDAFRGTGQPLPGRSGVTVWYLETGYQTATPDEKRAHYTGAENDPDAASAAVQAQLLADAVRLAYCQPHVGAFFNFELADEHRLEGWQSGLFWADWTPKPAYAAFRQATAEVARRAVDCPRLGLAAQKAAKPKPKPKRKPPRRSGR
jgi:hypothetical protein